MHLIHCDLINFFEDLIYLTLLKLNVALTCVSSPESSFVILLQILLTFCKTRVPSESEFEYFFVSAVGNI
jgi:hypothetical protein